MFSYLELLPPAEREKVIAQFNKEIQQGTFDPVPFYKSAALQQSAKDYSNSMITSITLVTGGVIVGASLLGFQIALAAGGLILLQQFMNSWKKQGDIAEAIDDDKDFIQYLPKEVQREYRQLNQAMVQSSGKALPFTDEAKKGTPVVAGYPQHTQTIPVTAQSLPLTQVVDSHSAQAVKFISDVEEPVSELYNPAIDLGSDPYSALIIGVPGAGKGVFLGNAVRVLKQRHPHIEIIGIDPKAKPEEIGIWEGGFDTVYRRAILNDTPDTVAQWVQRIVRDVQKKVGATLLVVDELTALQSKLKNAADKSIATIFEDYLTSLASLGNASQKYVWGVGQAGQGKALPFGTEVRNQMRTIALASSENVAAVQGLLRTDLIPQPAKSMDLVIAVLEKSEVSPNKVAFFDGKYGQWFPMPRLKNYGQDRKASFMQQPPEPVVSVAEEVKTEFVESAIAVAEPTELETCIIDKERAIDLITGQIMVKLIEQNRMPEIDPITTEMQDNPEKALWLGLKILKLSVTAASEQIFGTGKGGTGYQATAKVYHALQAKYGAIVEPTTETPSSPGAILFERLKQWRDELGGMPTLAELGTYIERLMGKSLTEPDLARILGLLEADSKKKDQN